MFFFQAEDGIRDYKVTGVQTCALPISTSATMAQFDHDSLIAAMVGRTIESLYPAGKRTIGADRKSTRLNSSHLVISYAVFCLKKKKQTLHQDLCLCPLIVFRMHL